MKKTYLYLITVCVFAGLSTNSQAQNMRYVDPIYAESDVEVVANITYATNIDFLISNMKSTKVPKDITALKTAVFLGNPIPAAYYNPADTSTAVKVTAIKMDVYKVKSSVDSKTDRPVIIFLHTGNFLPSPINGSPVGTRVDSSAIVLCKEWARRGYVAVSASYRLGWNPIAPTEVERTGTLLNAVYRAIHDVKKCVIYLKDDAAGANTYGISNNIALYGEGTGAYIVNAYTTLDSYSEIELPKFLTPAGKSVIDTANVGLIDGTRGLVNLYLPSTTSSEVTITIAAGGAMADTSWIEAGDKPMLAFQCIRDPFAPFDEGIVIVPTTGAAVVEVQGSNLYIKKAVELGNNDAFKDIAGKDIYTKMARAKYGKTYDYIYPSQTTITLNTGLEGLYPIDVTAGASVFQNQAGPWQWWDPTSPLATYVGQTGKSNHVLSLTSNPDMSPAKGRAYIDTIMGYMCPRVAIANGDYTAEDFASTRLVSAFPASVYPNPANNGVMVKLEGGNMIKHVAMYDLVGNLIYTSNGIYASGHYIDLMDIKNGFYFIEIQSDLGSVSRKVEVIH